MTTVCSFARTMMLFLVAAMNAPRVDGLQSAVAMANYSKDAVSLFNNMRLPAAMLAGGLVPLGITMNSPVKEEDAARTRVLKKAGAVIGVTSLLSEIMAVFYASIAINKLVELPCPETASVADLLSRHHNLPWLGANIHFMLGMMGIGLLVGIRTYLLVGDAALGRLVAGFSAGFFLQALAVVNRGIALGRSGSDHVDAKNFGQLCLQYGLSVVRFALRGRIGVCGVLAIGVTAAATVSTAVSFYRDFRNGAPEKID